ncbi:MAG TPA: hypothetical protein VKS21_07115 [Spirochaetota bacterium]|nr:hypothetical protein [Spirochaetota bacterium]
MKKLTSIHISIIITTGLFFLVFFGYTPFLSGENKKDFLRQNRYLFQAYRNLHENANQKNEACHNYAYNMMMSSEPHSIFMTEGGDNQVFSLVYFSYVEKKRPDVDFFDQKGNVFPRLYGDLMHKNPFELKLIRDLRDFQLYSTGRPVYLTWKRKKLHTLYFENLQNLYHKYKKQSENTAYPMQKKFSLTTLQGVEKALNNLVNPNVFDQSLKNRDHLTNQHLSYLGPWYYKRYGILFKVTPIRYAIADALTIYRKADYQTVKDYVKQVSKIDLSREEVDTYVAQLQNEGLVKKSGRKYMLVRQQANPFPETSLDDYWNNYYFDYTNVDNAKYWDYLTKEIFFGYHRLKIDYLKEQQAYYQNLWQNRSRPAYLQKKQYYQEQMQPQYTSMTNYCYNNPSALFLYAYHLMRRSKHRPAITVLKKVIAQQEDLHHTYLQLVNQYTQLAQKEKNKEKEHLEQALKYANKELWCISNHFRRNGKLSELENIYDFNSPYLRRHRSQLQLKVELARKQFDMESFRGRIETPYPELKKQQQAAASKKPEALFQLAQLYARRFAPSRALNTYEKLLGLQKGNMDKYIQNLLNLMEEYQSGRYRQMVRIHRSLGQQHQKAIQTGIRLLYQLQQNFPEYAKLNVKPERLLKTLVVTVKLHFFLGSLYEQPRTIEQAAMHYEQAQRLCNALLKQARTRAEYRRYYSIGVGLRNKAKSKYRNISRYLQQQQQQRN